MGCRCLRCANVVAKAFPTLSWEQVVSQFGGDPRFESLVREAWASHEGKTKAFTPELFEDTNRHGYRVEKSYTLFTQADLSALAPGVTWKDLTGYIQTDEIVDEKNVRQEGVLLPDDAPPKVIFFREGYTALQKQIHTPERQLRSAQGEDVAAWWRKDLQKVSPGPMGHRKTCDSLATLTSAIAQMQEAKKVVAEELALQGSGASLKPAEEEPAEDQDEIVFASEEATLLGPSSSKRGKGKSKGKSNGKNRGKGKGLQEISRPQRHRASRSVAGSQQDDRASAWGAQSVASYDSAGGATTKAGSPSDKADNTVQRWTSTLSLERLLKGEALGLHLHHANKALGGLRTSSGESSVAYVLLKGHIDTFNSAMKLLPDAIEKTTAKQRQAILRDLLLAGVKIPLFTGANLLSQM